MIKAKCVQKIRDNRGRIKGYVLQDLNGVKLKFESGYLKSLIANNKIDVVNLTLSSDGKLVNKSIITRVTAPFATKEIKAFYTSCQLKSLSKTNHIIYIPDDVRAPNNLSDESDLLRFTEAIKHLHGTIKVTGGAGLESTCAMFKDCEADVIDITELNTQNVKSMKAMFSNCKAKKIIFGDFDTSSVENMERMFENCKVEELNLSSFNTMSVINMSQMFMGCETKSIDISLFDTYSLRSMNNMFSFCTVEHLNIGKLNTHQVWDMYSMFSNCKADIIDLTGLNTYYVDRVAYMFAGCEANIVDLSKFSTGNISDLGDMFIRSKINVLKTDNTKIMEAYKKDTGRSAVNTQQ